MTPREQLRAALSEIEKNVDDADGATVGEAMGPTPRRTQAG